MLPYVLLLFFPAIFPTVIYPSRRGGMARNYSDVSQRRNKLMISMFFIGLFILLSLRDITVGKDLIAYEAIYEFCIYTPFKDLSGLQWELGYTIYNKLVSLITEEYRFFLIITALIILRPIYRLYSEEKKYSYLLIVLFINMPCFLMIFSGLRQAIAVSVGVLAYMAIDNKKYTRGVLLILLAMSFHTSAFVLILLYPASFLKIKVKHLLFVVPLLLGVYLFRKQIFIFVLGFLPGKYVEFYGELQQTGAFGMMLLFLLFTTFAFVVLDEDTMTNKDYCVRNILLLATILQLFVPIHGLIQRVSYYFLVFVPVSIISIVKAPKRTMKEVSNLAVMVMGIFFSIYFFYTALFSTDNLLDVFPYKFFWSN